MKILHCNFVVILSILSTRYCTTSELVSHDSIIDVSAILKELAAIINILSTRTESHNEDADLNITGLLNKYGYPVEEHQVETSDGYVLTIFRIPSKGPVVFLMHGLLTSADDWVTAGPETSLAYLLASAGYDVWMGNTRGNKYSRQHVRILPKDPRFWDFSWDEMGREDLPAMIDYVLNTTNTDKLTYIGYSQGTTTFFVMCSEKPDYNAKISTMIALAPMARTSYTKSPLARMIVPFYHYAMEIADLFQINEVLPKPIKYINTQTPLCEIGNGIICMTILFCFFGFDYEQLNRTNMPVIFGHVPSGASAKQFIHYMQNMASRIFRKYDYGEDKNLKIYGSREPPKYEVDKISAPVALFYSDNDWLSDVEDVKYLKNKLQNVTEFYRVPFKKFNHIDYLWAKDAKRLVYDRILELLKFEQ